MKNLILILLLLPFTVLSQNRIVASSDTHFTSIDTVKTEDIWKEFGAIMFLHYDLKETIYTYTKRTTYPLLTPIDSFVVDGGFISIDALDIRNINKVSIDIKGIDKYTIDKLERIGNLKKIICEGGVIILLSKWQLSLFYPVDKNGWQKEICLRLYSK